MKSYFTVFCFLMLFLTAIFTTSFAQINWTKNPNPVLIPGSPGTWSDYSLWPSCILYDGSTYHKWYGGYDEIYTRIGYATSPDGITWTEYAGNPVLDVGPSGSWNDESVEVPYVLFDGSTYHMWYSGYDGTNSSIGYATSTDGITWTPYAGNPIMVKGPAGSWAETSIWSPCVRFDGSTYHMWFTGWNASAFICIGYATSADGMIWTEYADNPVLIPDVGNWDKQRVEVPDVLFDGSVYHMWFTGGNTTSWWEWRIGYATSSDGIQWTKYAGNPVLNVGAAGSWDDQWVGFARVLLDTTTSEYKMWYCGGDGSWNAKFGYATAPVIINVPDNFETIQAAIDAAHDGNVVLVDEGTYYENINFKGKAITVASQFYVDGDESHIDNTIIDGSKSSNPDCGSVVSLISGEDTTSVLCGFTIRGGSGTKSNFEELDFRAGGGVFIENSGGKIINNKVINNTINQTDMYCFSGGIDVLCTNDVTILIRENEIAYNSVYADWGGGGGVGLICRGHIVFERNHVHHNLYSSKRHGFGGGIVVLGADGGIAGQIDLLHNLVTDNTILAEANYKYGGGIYSESPNLLMVGNIISKNKGYYGGGFCTLSLSSFDMVSKTIMINNTIADNTGISAGAIWNRQSYLTIINSILWGNHGNKQIGGMSPRSTDFAFSNIQGGWTGGSIMDIEPKFVHVERTPGDTLFYCLDDESPCIDSGPDSSFFYDNESSPGLALWPAMNSVRNDMGAYGGKYTYDIEDLPKIFEWVLDIPGKTTQPPLSYSLNQNYPNPFNPITNIDYRIPNSEFVTLKIYNLLGEKVVTLVSEKKKAGYHQVEWNASGFASGIYYYSLTAGEFQQVRKMVLLK